MDIFGPDALFARLSPSRKQRSNTKRVPTETRLQTRENEATYCTIRTGCCKPRRRGHCPSRLEVSLFCRGPSALLSGIANERRPLATRVTLLATLRQSCKLDVKKYCPDHLIRHTCHVCRELLFLFHIHLVIFFSIQPNKTLWTIFFFGSALDPPCTGVRAPIETDDVQPSRPINLAAGARAGGGEC